MKYHADRCIFCDRVWQACRFDCLGLSQEDGSWPTRIRTIHGLLRKEEEVRILLEKIGLSQTLVRGCGENQPENA
jgi:hypothetical protein